MNNDLCTGRKWAMWGHLDVHGVSAHSGNNYTAGRNALVEAAYKILAIQNCNDMEKGTNMNPAVIKGGTVPNAIPDAVSPRKTTSCWTSSTLSVKRKAILLWAVSSWAAVRMPATSL